MNIYIIGIGMGESKSLTVRAKEKIENADIIIGARRIAEPFLNGKKVFFEYTAEKVADILKNNECENAAILFSGDVSFFSGAKKLCEMYPDAEVISGISSVSYFCSKIGLAYDDMNIVSMHGRECNIVSEVRTHKKTFALLGENPCGKLCDYGFGDVEVFIGENLSYETENILHGTANDFRDLKITPLSVIVIVNKSYDNRIKIGIKDEEFITGKAPMTKSTVRAVSVSKLELKENDICYDIGAGTGSISIEMALLCPRGKVYAVEKNAEALALIAENALKFKTDNINIIQGEAPDILDDLPKADKVFIGGSSGNVEAIIEKCDCNKVVINSITLETLDKTIKAMQKFGYEYEIVQVSASYAKSVGGYNMMTAQNPVFVITGDKK